MRRLLQRSYLSFAIFFLFSCVVTFLPFTETASSSSSNTLNELPTTERLRQREVIQKVRLLDNNTGYALTTNRLLRTTDSRSWQDITPFVSSTQTIYEAFFLDKSNGWAVLSSGNLTTAIYVAITRDGGKSWHNHAINLSQEVLIEFGGIAYIDFVDADHGWLMLKQITGSNFSRGRLLSTNDGGQSWQELNAPPIGDRINFVSQQTGWLAGGAGGNHLYVTHDGGKSWQEKNIAANAVYDSPVFINKNTGILPVTSFLSNARRRGDVETFKKSCVKR
jgi:photosystem II stability/assembly factor-like uncharacterized protein